MSTTELIEKIKALPKAKRERLIEFIQHLDDDAQPKQKVDPDLTIINRRAAHLNREATDVLDY